MELVKKCVSCCNGHRFCRLCVAKWAQKKNAAGFWVSIRQRRNYLTSGVTIRSPPHHPLISVRPAAPMVVARRRSTFVGWTPWHMSAELKRIKGSKGGAWSRGRAAPHPCKNSLKLQFCINMSTPVHLMSRLLPTPVGTRRYWCTDSRPSCLCLSD